MSQQFPEVDATVQEIPATELKRRLDGGERMTLLDTRRPTDYEQWHITHPNLETVNVPFTKFLDGDDPAGSVPDGVPEGPLVTCCAKGISSFYVAAFLTREGWDVVGLHDGMEGWARLYEATEVATGTDATVVQYHRPSSGCLSYLVVAGDEALVVDPLRAFVERYAADASDRGATVTTVADTHVHADHVSGVRAVAEATGATVVLPEGATDRGLDFEASLASADDTLTVGDATVDVVALPGHTTEMVGYRVGDVLLTGDTLFTDSVARPDLEDGDRAAEAARTLHDTLSGLSRFPDETVVAPGHTSPDARPAEDGTFTARLGDLRETLEALSMDEETFVDYVTSDLPPQPNEYETIIRANLGLESVDDDEAFELELGPNNCAAN